ncbi:hypothetical protein [Gibbsiella quercinecans]|uniref:hypothetical protein n=1 Tax=Gibbsiella quercinecans TaxID=929813 RepID=UPI003A4D7491
MKYLKSIVITIVMFMFCLIGNTFDITGMLNAGHFIGWFFAILQLIVVIVALTPEGQAKILKINSSALESKGWGFYDVFIDVFSVILFAWLGWFILAAVVGICAGMKPGIREQLNKRRKEHLPESTHDKA